MWMSRFSFVAAVSALMIATACPPPPTPPTGDDGLAYMGLDNAVRRYSSDNGLAEEHTITRDETFVDRAVINQIARFNGFVVDARTFTWETTGEQVQVTRFLDCLNSCITPQEPIVLFSWPMVAGESKQQEVTVDLVDNAQPVGTRQETHSIQVGNETQIALRNGANFTGFPVFWSRNVDRALKPNEPLSTSANFFVVPDIGIVQYETDGQIFQVEQAPESAATVE